MEYCGQRFAVTDKPQEFRHAFERAGLGVAPYICVGFHKDEGTCCAFCGTPIIYCYEIEAANGRRFVVGSDCVAKTGDAGLVRSIKSSPEARAFRRAKAAYKDRVVTAALEQMLASPPEALQASWYLNHMRHSLPYCGAAGRARHLKEARAIIAKCANGR